MMRLIQNGYHRRGYECAIKNLGVDYIELSPNPVVRRKMNRIGLTKVGDISWPEHVGIFTIPVRAAVQFGVPLIVWGENSQNEYGGPAAAADERGLNRRWLEEFGGLLGLRVKDLIGQQGIEARHLIQYTYPTDADLQRTGVTGVFLGYYFPWDGFQNALIAQGFGFETLCHLVGVLRRRQAGATVEVLGDAGLAGDEPGHPDQELPVVPSHLARFGGDLAHLLNYGAVDFVVVLAIQKRVVHPGDTCLGGVDVGRCDLGWSSTWHQASQTVVKLGRCAYACRV